jgi:hypothetical protein
MAPTEPQTLSAGPERIEREDVAEALKPRIRLAAKDGELLDEEQAVRDLLKEVDW